LLTFTIISGFPLKPKLKERRAKTGDNRTSRDHVSEKVIVCA
jgi:hypothetical protein